LATTSVLGRLGVADRWSAILRSMKLSAYTLLAIAFTCYVWVIAWPDVIRPATLVGVAVVAFLVWCDLKLERPRPPA
jgi:hypothetical protein